MIQRAIPKSGELLPVVGLGSWIQFDVGQSERERQLLKEVLAKMHQLKGTLIDSSPMYGRAEKVIGDLTRETGLADNFFYATKVWTTGRREGIEQMENSLTKMQRSTIDLMQVHNLVDWKTHLETLKDWKQQGKVKYIGITHYTSAYHEKLEQIINATEIDFVQFNYSITARNAEKRLLDVARDKGVAVIINEPFDKGALFKAVKGKSLPSWVSEYDIDNWSAFFLKYILAHPAVNCVIPGTSDPSHLEDNMKTGYGRLPGEEGRRLMVDYINNL